jgi:plastocyanin
MLFSLLAMATLLLAACGSQTSSTPSSSTSVVSAAQGSTPTTSTNAVQVIQVKIVEQNGMYAFEPATITIPKGAQVVWTNASDAPHTVTSDTSAFGTTSNLSTNQTFMQVFNTAGTYAYHCTIHPYMKGTITVTS